MYWLAWKSSHVLGMGFLQDKPNATKDDEASKEIVRRLTETDTYKKNITEDME